MKGVIKLMNNYRTKLHIEPPKGWLNDPVGLCQKNGTYYVYFQYSPDDVLGGKKVWGLYKGHELLNLSFDGEHILTDSYYDKDGAYSGSAFVENDEIYIFYTGNVKEDVENADYITSGRRSNTVLTTTKDGKKYTDKVLLLTNEDYPKNYTQHIRDPKVFKENDTYFMVLGGRTRQDIGKVLLYSSEDMKNWEFVKDIAPKNHLGYMLECPDVFALEGKNILSISPQGVKREEFTFQNVYSSGYFISEKSFIQDNPELDKFIDWDYGFDFYAPQTFLDENDRRILIGWAGMPDAENEYTNKSIEHNWQHLMTIPRVLTYKENAVLSQIPQEFYDKLDEEVDDLAKVYDRFYAEVDIKNQDGVIANICEGLELSYSDNVFKMKFTNDIGAGRTVRNCKIDTLSNIKVIMDTSIIEVFLNDGEKVMTSRIYPNENTKSQIFNEDYRVFKL